MDVDRVARNILREIHVARWYQAGATSDPEKAWRRAHYLETAINLAIREARSKGDDVQLAVLRRCRDLLEAGDY